MSFYRKVYPVSWRTIFGNYQLLFFGLFASILGFHEIKILFNLNDTSPDFLSSTIMNWAKIFFMFASSSLTWNNFSGFLATFGIFIIFAIATVLVVSSQGALIKAAIKTSNKKEKLPFLEYLRAGVEKFWPLLGLNIINTLLGYFFVILVIDPLIYFLANQADWLIYIILATVTFFILLPIVIIISFVTRYGAAYIVLKNQKFSEAFTNSWLLFKTHWILTIENAILLMIITTVFYLIIISALVFTFTPFLILSTFMAFSPLIFWLTLTIGGLLGIIIFLGGTAFFGAFYNLVWAYTFIEITGKIRPYSKVHRLAHKHLPRLTR